MVGHERNTHEHEDRRRTETEPLPRHRKHNERDQIERFGWSPQKVIPERSRCLSQLRPLSALILSFHIEQLSLNLDGLLGLEELLSMRYECLIHFSAVEETEHISMIIDPWLVHELPLVHINYADHIPPPTTVDESTPNPQLHQRLLRDMRQGTPGGRLAARSVSQCAVHGPRRRLYSAQ